MYELNDIKFYTQKLKLLYIENDDNTRASTFNMLRDLFHEVILLKSIDSALEISMKPYDLILLDIDESNTDAIQLCKTIKEDDENKIIIITSSTLNYALDIINIGIDKSITKPIKDLQDISLLLIEVAKKASRFKHFKNQEFLLEQKNKMIDTNIYTTTSNLDGSILEISNAYLEFTGYTKSEIIGQNHRIFRHHELDKNIIKNLWDTLKKDKTWTGELKNHKKSGEEYWIYARIAPLYDIDNNKIGYTAVQEDITNQIRLEELSIKDPLTLLFNKRHFDTYLKAEYKKAIWKKEYFALILLGVDFFEKYKDKYGYVKSDEILLQISNELRKGI